MSTVPVGTNSMMLFSVAFLLLCSLLLFPKTPLVRWDLRELSGEDRPEAGY